MNTASQESWTTHASERAAQRAVRPEAVAAALTWGTEFPQPLGRTAYFVDAPAAAGAVRAAAVACRDLDLDEAWDEPDVQALLEHDLLWHGPSEPLPL